MDANLSNQDSLKVEQNEDGSFAIEWDSNDPRWSFLNDLTSEEIQTIMIKAIMEGINGPLQ